MIGCLLGSVTCSAATQEVYRQGILRGETSRLFRRRGDLVEEVVWERIIGCGWKGGYEGAKKKKDSGHSVSQSVGQTGRK